MTTRRTFPRRFRRSPRTALSAAMAALLATGLMTSGCYSYSVEIPDSAPINEYRETDLTASSSVWGLVQDDPVIAKRCEGEALDQVRITTNYGYALLTVLSLGLWSPMDVNYRCAEKTAFNNDGV